MIIPDTMAGIELTGHGDFGQLRYNARIAVPKPLAGEVLIKVLACGINNTDINTRIGWYAGEIKTATDAALEGGSPVEAGDWTGQGLAFPRIQGADACGVIVEVGKGVEPARTGSRVIVQACLVSLRQGSFTPWLGSERDGAFAQYVCVPSADCHAVTSSLSNAELASIPCAWGTAENLLSRAAAKAGDTVLVTGASGNVGLAAVQLAKLRHANVIAVCADDKAQALLRAGASKTVARDAPLVAVLGENSVDVVIDVVGGPQWPQLCDLLRPGGRYAVSGAIAGPIVPLDLRKLYLKDLSFFGCTAQSREGFLRLVALANSGALKPLVAKTFPLHEIVAAQQAFLSKQHVGKIIMIPPE